MTTKHTQGKWEVRHKEETGDVFVGCSIFIIADEIWGTILAKDDESKVLNREEREANARLISAAPEMLEALKNIRKELQLSGNWIANDYGWLSNREAIIAAIAKAEGV
jgi:hypothetical protein